MAPLGPSVKKAPEAHQVSPPKPNPYSADCPTRMALDRIADKWTVLLLGLINQRPMRFNQLRQAVDGLSQKMLSQTLKALERDGLVTRTVHATIPPRVDYALTALGHSLLDPVDVLGLWARRHRAEIETARHQYDTSNSGAQSR